MSETKRKIREALAKNAPRFDNMSKILMKLDPVSDDFLKILDGKTNSELENLVDTIDRIEKIEKMELGLQVSLMLQLQDMIKRIEKIESQMESKK